MVEPAVRPPADTTVPVPGGVLLRMRALLPRLPGKLRGVGEEVLADPTAAARSTIVELAERSDTSPTTVTRFCRALGFDGYADMRLAIATATGRTPPGGDEVDLGREIRPTDPPTEVLGMIAAADSRAISATAAQLDVEVACRAAAAIAGARRIDLYGLGGSAAMAEDLQVRLHRIDVACWTWRDLHGGLTSAALLGPSDAAVAISYSGCTRETVELLAEAGSHGATTIAVTSYPQSPLADAADLVLTTAIPETPFSTDVFAARHAQLVVLDLLYVLVAQRSYGRTSSAFTLTGQAVAGHRIAPDAPMGRRRRARPRAP